MCFLLQLLQLLHETCPHHFVRKAQVKADVLIKLLSLDFVGGWCRQEPHDFCRHASVHNGDQWRPEKEHWD